MADIDTLKEVLRSPVGTVIEGSGAIMLTLWDALPDAIRLAIGVATLVHIIIRIRKELK